MNNIFKDIPQDVSEEIFEVIIQNKNVHIERIVSYGQSTPVGKWLLQDKKEWVILLEGASEIVFEDDKSRCSMKPGDYLYIENQRRHRVEYTLKNKKTICFNII